MQAWICVSFINLSLVNDLFIKKNWIAATKITISLLAFVYIAYLIVGLFLDYLGPNPIEVLTHATGEWGLYFLLFTLCITPLRRHLRLNQLMKFRRFLGLWSFAFIFIHLFVYILFDHFFAIDSIVDDILKRPYIAVGFAAFLVMLPLAITSLKGIQRKMGRSWLTLHKAVYLVSILAIIHYWWLTKADYLIPSLCALVLIILLCDRIYAYRQKSKAQ